MRKFPFVLYSTPVEELLRYRGVKHEVSMEQLDPFHGLVSSRNALRDTSITNVGILIFPRMLRFGEATWEWWSAWYLGSRVPAQQGYIPEVIV